MSIQPRRPDQMIVTGRPDSGFSCRVSGVSKDGPRGGVDTLNLNTEDGPPDAAYSWNRAQPRL